MNWLARIEIDSQIMHSRKISNDTYSWHKALWRCFPNQPNSNRDFLTRVDEKEAKTQCWILAERKPECPEWCPSEGFSLKEILPSFLEHKHYVFDLKANPVKKLVQRGIKGETLYNLNGKRKQGKRVPLVKEEDLYAWLIRKGKQGGFRIIKEKPLEIGPSVENYLCKSKKGRIAYHGGVQFRGGLEVTNREAFKETYQSGIGSAKSLGFGLFLLAPITL